MHTNRDSCIAVTKKYLILLVFLFGVPQEPNDKLDLLSKYCLEGRLPWDQEFNLQPPTQHKHKRNMPGGMKVKGFNGLPNKSVYDITLLYNGEPCTNRDSCS